MMQLSKSKHPLSRLKHSFELDFHAYPGLISKRYYNTIHPTLPLLSNNPSVLNRLTDCHAKLREAFFLSLDVAVRALSPLNVPPSDFAVSQLVPRCLNAIDEAQPALADNDSSRQIFNNIVYAQSLVFLIIASDKPAPGGVSSAELLGRLAARVAELRLNDSRILATIKDQDYETFEASRRLFWATFILDRFHASSRTTDTLLPLHCGSLSRDDFNALGEVGYNLARKSVRISLANQYLHNTQELQILLARSTSSLVLVTLQILTPLHHLLLPR